VSSLIAIDPGTRESAIVQFNRDLALPTLWKKAPNAEILEMLAVDLGDRLFVEGLASYGMAVGMEVFHTAYWIGRFSQRWEDVTGVPVHLVYRRDVKLHLCGLARAKDPNVRQALIDKYGPGKELAIGKKATPGPLYGMSGDCWAALAVAVTAAEAVESTHG
jgi:hypothetical protein